MGHRAVSVSFLHLLHSHHSSLRVNRLGDILVVQKSLNRRTTSPDIIFTPWENIEGLSLGATSTADIQPHAAAAWMKPGGGKSAGNNSQLCQLTDSLDNELYNFGTIYAQCS